MKLYFNPLSPNCRRATIVAAHLGLPIELKPIDFTKGEHKAPEFLAINPNGMIPTLVDGDFSLWESRAIMQYLAAKKPEANLLGHSDKEWADIARWLFWDASHLARHTGTVVFENMVKRILNMGPPDQAAIAAAIEQLKRFYGVLDAALKGKKYLVGGRLTVADLALAATFTYADTLKLPVDGFANLKAWLARIAALDCWKKTEPQLPAAAE
jgi:glutathione S-transferase